MNLSDHFTLEELTVSDAGARAGLINAPSELQLLHLKALASELEICRMLLGHPIVIHSAFRSPAVNKLVGGVPSSAHLSGYAADFICPAYGSPLVVAKRLAGSLASFDQLIHEYGVWVHLSVDPQNRKQVLHILADGKGYQSGLEAGGNELMV